MRFLFIFMLAFWATGTFAADSTKRQVTIPWRAVEGASYYEFQLSRNPEMDPTIFKKKYQTLQSVIRLRPGTYYFRVRGFDAKKLPGPWTQVEGFAVNANAAKLVSPEKKARFSRPVDEDGIRFEWEGGLEKTEMVLEISDSQGPMLSRRVSRNSFVWVPEQPGVYQWRVGYRSPTGMEWSEKRAFLIKRSAIPEETTTRQKTLLERSDPPESWILAKLVQSGIFYSVDDRALGTRASAAALVGGVGFEYRFQVFRRAKKFWRLGGEVVTDIYRQIILGSTFVLPRIRTRLYYTKVMDDWRVGPLIHFGYNRIALFSTSGNVISREAKTSRMSFGAGILGKKEVSDTLKISGLVLTRVDFGGAENDVSSALSSAIGFELGFGASFLLGESRHQMVDLMLRVVNESYNWTNAFGDSAISNTYIVLDAGFGLHL